ncbi:unnamed protein product [Clonostachys byssicola]|uniref:ER membrane protein complex subunit 2 n=1 Tax=Clonostachys byssicola TaxID=160290 RepID=A0A9N9Y6C9_9HYPO|nr:unnamed protein product [Clonostachys byssicola]
MAPSLLGPQANLSPAEALQLAQQAPEILRNNPKAISSSPLVSLFTAAETADLWTIYTNLLVACLRTKNDQSAHECLDRLVLRFGEKNEWIMALQGLVKEAEAESRDQLQAVLGEYDSILKENSSNIPIAKRKVALLRSMGSIPEAIASLTALLDFTPTDAEGWAELSDLYLTQGLYSQAIFSLEEVLVLVPNAWNVHARLGEILLMAANSETDSSNRHLAEALKRFCRSIELCDDYLRGYYGLKKVTDQVLSQAGKSKKQDADEPKLPDQKQVEKLNQVATAKLGEIVRRYNAKEKLWQGYDADEIAAAKTLLEASAPQLVR